MLQKAVKAGWKDAAHLAKDTDLDPLRDRDDFKKLLAELEKKSLQSRDRRGVVFSVSHDRSLAVAAPMSGLVVKWLCTGKHQAESSTIMIDVLDESCG